MKTVPNLVLLTGITFLTLTYCKEKQTFEEHVALAHLGTPVKIEYFKAVPSRAFLTSDSASFSITDQASLWQAIEEIKEANNPSMWKGAGWHRLKLYYRDTVVFLNTDDNKIGLRASGGFYLLKNPNFITRRLNQH